MIPFITTRTVPSALVCGCAFSVVTRPWVAQRVWPSPAVAPEAVVRAGGVAQLGEVADGADRLGDALVLGEEREAGGVVAAVLEPLEAGEDELTAGSPADVPDDPAHARRSFRRDRRAVRRRSG